MRIGKNRRPAATGGSKPRRRLDDGYTLVALVVMVTVLNIMIAKALPLWSGIITRDKEHEFIFRGLQYAEAIRVYQQRYGQWPTRLDELIKSDRRCIRQLWDNPLADIKTRKPDGEGWVPIFDGPVNVPDANIPEEQQADRGGLFEDDNKGKPEEVRVGPIVGVRSMQQPEVVEREIPNWYFTIRLFTSRVGGENPNAFLAVNADDIGRLLPGQNSSNNSGQNGVGGGGGLQQGFDPSRQVGGGGGLRGGRGGAPSRGGNRTKG